MVSKIKKPCQFQCKFCNGMQTYDTFVNSHQKMGVGDSQLNKMNSNLWIQRKINLPNFLKSWLMQMEPKLMHGLNHKKTHICITYHGLNL